MRSLFGARGQLVVGILTCVVTIAVWAWFSVVQSPTVTTIFQISMFYGLMACYGVVATALGYKATERVETAVVENIEHADVVES